MAKSKLCSVDLDALDAVTGGQSESGSGEPLNYPFLRYLPRNVRQGISDSFSRAPAQAKQAGADMGQRLQDHGRNVGLQAAHMMRQPVLAPPNVGHRWDPR